MKRALRLFAATCSAWLLAGCADTSGAASHADDHARVTLPSYADEALVVRDPASDAVVSVRIESAPHVPVGGAVRFVRTAHGAEDFVVVGDPRATSIAYVVSFDAHTAALRLVANQLELLDPAGFPRLRAIAPTAVDARGAKLAVHAHVEGCAVDTDPAPPFRRTHVAPGARSCTLRVSWSAARASYPIVVDPAWESTESMAHARYGHVATTLPTGEVLVAGGLVGSPPTMESSTDTTELFSGGTWAAGASMTSERYLAALAPLASGDLFVSGGLLQADVVGQTVLQTSETYSLGTHTWTTSGDLLRPRAGHTATAVGDGTVLVAGGYDNTGIHFATAELYSGGTFAAAGSINTSRFYHSAVGLSGNRVLLGGGTDPETGALATLELWTKGSGWSSAASLASMATARTLAAATLLANDDVLFAGGYNSDDGALASAEIYHASTNTWTTTGSLAHARYDAVAATLPDGRALFVGGQDTTGDWGDAELFDPGAATFAALCGDVDSRAFGHTVSVLGDGRALVAGGYDYFPARLLASAALYDPDADAGADVTTCHHELDAGEDAGADASTSDAGGDAGSDGKNGVDAAVDAGARDSGDPATDVALFEAGGGCEEAGGAGGSPIAFISALFAIAMLRRRQRRSAR